MNIILTCIFYFYLRRHDFITTKIENEIYRIKMSGVIHNKCPIIEGYRLIEEIIIIKKKTL
jgi:hypothetical protein